MHLDVAFHGLLDLPVHRAGAALVGGGDRDVADVALRAGDQGHRAVQAGVVVEVVQVVLLAAAVGELGDGSRGGVPMSGVNSGADSAM